MKKHIIVLTVCILSLLASVFAFTGCGSDKNPSPTNEEISISLNHTTISMQVGGQASLVASVHNYYGKLIFESSDKTVADVDLRGVVIGISEGNAVITVMAGNKSATCAITVTASEEESAEVEVLPILKLLTKPEMVSVGYEFGLAAELVLSGDALDGVQFGFYVTDEIVAEISGNTFRAKSAGITDLVVFCEYGGRVYSDRCNIQII